jgi:hypothetical protein
MHGGRALDGSTAEIADFSDRLVDVATSVQRPPASREHPSEEAGYAGGRSPLVRWRGSSTSGREVGGDSATLPERFCVHLAKPLRSDLGPRTTVACRIGRVSVQGVSGAAKTCSHVGAPTQVGRGGPRSASRWMLAFCAEPVRCCLTLASWMMGIGLVVYLLARCAGPGPTMGDRPLQATLYSRHPPASLASCSSPSSRVTRGLPLPSRGAGGQPSVDAVTTR